MDHSVPHILETVRSDPINEPRHPGARLKVTSMANNSFRIPMIAMAAALLMAPATSFAQSGAPAREGNIWDWRDHQPTEAEVSRMEKAAGLAATPSDKASVENLYQQLMRQQPR